MGKVGDSKKYGKLRRCTVISQNGITYFAFNIKFLKFSLISTNEGPFRYDEKCSIFHPKSVSFSGYSIFCRTFFFS